MVNCTNYIIICLFELYLQAQRMTRLLHATCIAVTLRKQVGTQLHIVKGIAYMVQRHSKDNSLQIQSSVR